MTDLIRMLRLIRAYRRASALPLDALIEIQRGRLEALLRHAQARSTFWRERLAGMDPGRVRIEDLPILDKATLMERWDDVCCDPRLRLADLERFMADPACAGKRYLDHVLIRTSGTSGRPVVVAYGPEAFDHVRAVNLARGSMVDASGLRILQRALDPEPLRLACVLMDGSFAPSHANFLHQPSASRWLVAIERISLRLPVAEIVERLNRFQPRLLFAYPSVLELLCEEAAAGRLAILAGPRARVVSLSEPLPAWLRREAEQTFHAPVFDLYGAGECLPIARSCEHGTGLHVNVDMAALEIADDAGRVLPPGRYGTRVLVTNLFNPVLPLIRYELRDVAALAEGPCPCGSCLPRLLSVRGRTDDLVWLAHPAGGRRALHPYLVLETLLSFEAVRDWQLVQEAPDALRLDLVLAAGARIEALAVETAVRGILENVVPAGAVRLQLRQVARLAPDPLSGKVRRVLALAGRRRVTIERSAGGEGPVVE